MTRLSRVGLALTCTLSLLGSVHAQSEMERNFIKPPDSARPRVWWHWLSGNVTKEGITADLEWMHRINLGGFQMFDGDLSTPRFVEKPLIWMTPEWKDAWHHAATEANRLHLEMGMAASGGWSETAGPWVQPAAGYEEVCVERDNRSSRGPVSFHAQILAEPPATVGKYPDNADSA